MNKKTKFSVDDAEFFDNTPLADLSDFVGGVFDEEKAFNSETNTKEGDDGMDNDSSDENYKDNESSNCDVMTTTMKTKSTSEKLLYSSGVHSRVYHRKLLNIEQVRIFL